MRRGRAGHALPGADARRAALARRAQDPSARVDEQHEIRRDRRLGHRGRRRASRFRRTSCPPTRASRSTRRRPPAISPTATCPMRDASDARRKAGRCDAERRAGASGRAAVDARDSRALRQHRARRRGRPLESFPHRSHEAAVGRARGRRRHAQPLSGSSTFLITAAGGISRRVASTARVSSTAASSRRPTPIGCVRSSTSPSSACCWMPAPDRHGAIASRERSTITALRRPRRRDDLRVSRRSVFGIAGRADARRRGGADRHRCRDARPLVPGECRQSAGRPRGPHGAAATARRRSRNAAGPLWH